MAAKRGRPIARSAISIAGIVQGVGFRPFVFRLATELGLSGWVANNSAGVIIEAQSTDERLAHFARRIRSEAPPLAVITELSRMAVPELADETGFTIRESVTGGACTAQLPPDTALCPDCLAELFDPQDRRYRYPFITCTNCGPRYSIITGIPYDRAATTMAHFPLCPDCEAEYRDPANRRFHAEPLCCPACGPSLRLTDRSGQLLACHDNACAQAVELLKAGNIVAIKGISGYHLAVDAENRDAVELLRRRKHRDEKPFAVMVPDIAVARTLAALDNMEERLLTSPEAPIVIARKRLATTLAPLIAPQNGWLGLMLPYAPLHHLLFAQPDISVTTSGPDRKRTGFTALVMTSANNSSEPIIYADEEAVQQLQGLADYVLGHNRPIHVGEDDSVIRVFQGKPLFYRRSRGYAPRAISLPFRTAPILATGAELKNAVCCASGDSATLSHFIGDLQGAATYDSFRHITAHLTGLLQFKPAAVACDLHPDYLSTTFAQDYCRTNNIPLHRIQHHHAHMAACMAENRLDGDTIGVIFDGTGLGDDGTVWGGEFLVGGYHGYRRAGHLSQVRLPGGDAAIREPWRMALSWLYSAIGPEALEQPSTPAEQLPIAERRLFAQVLERGLNAPYTSSCGRLFDAVAALLGLRQTVSYDGQAAIELEALAETAPDTDNQIYPFTINACDTAPFRVDFTPMFPALLTAIAAGTDRGVIARCFHATVAQATVEACRRIADATGLTTVVLSGGVFQNRLLTEMVYTALTAGQFRVYTHRLSPPNDGCIALGQAAIAGWKTRR